MRTEGQSEIWTSVQKYNTWGVLRQQLFYPHRMDCKYSNFVLECLRLYTTCFQILFSQFKDVFSSYCIVRMPIEGEGN